MQEATTQHFDGGRFRLCCAVHQECDVREGTHAAVRAAAAAAGPGRWWDMAVNKRPLAPNSQLSAASVLLGGSGGEQAHRPRE